MAVKEHGDRAHAVLLKARRLGEQRSHGPLVTETQAVARMEAVHEIDAAPLRAANEPFHFAPALAGIRQLPLLAMVWIVLRRIEIRVHPARRAESEHRAAMFHRPGRTEKAFDDAATLEIERVPHRSRMCHAASAATSAKLLDGR